MDERNDGSSAFPVIPPVDETGRSAVGYPYPDPGMRLRDYFAAKAIQGLLANPGGPIQKSSQSGWSLTNCTHIDVAFTAYSMADAMMKARES